MTDKPRKTVDVAVMVDKLNKAIECQYGDRSAQSALCFAIELALHESNSYAGFQWHDRNGRINPCPDPDHRDYYSRRYYAPRKGNR